MKVLTLVVSEKLSIEKYVRMMQDNNVNNKILSTKYEINHDWNSTDTGYFVVQYDRPILREKTL